MERKRERLEAITRRFIDRNRPLDDLTPEAQALRDLLEDVTAFRAGWEEGAHAHGTRLDSGLAISPTYAAMCLRELRRTAAFIRGLAQAIEAAGGDDQPVHVLYAGCGPYALLALPLMTVFPRQRVVFTLLEFHREVLDRALALIAAFGFADRVIAAECVDATRYRISTQGMPDVIVSETMAVCLHNEPQVSITRHLLSQAPHARMVPESVRVELCALDGAKEHRLVPADHVGAIPPPERDRIGLGTVFEVDACHVEQWRGLACDRLPAGRTRIPFLEKRYKLHLLTRIVVCGDTVLQDYDCSLTAPQRLKGGERLAGGEVLQFHYRLGAHPGLGYEVMAD